jgi:hypothetical protein
MTSYASCATQNQQFQGVPVARRLSLSTNPGGPVAILPVIILSRAQQNYQRAPVLG